MSIVEVKVPDIGDFKEVEIIELMIKVGDTIKVDQSLITVESDKASMEIPSSAAGVVKEIKVKVGDKVAMGSLLLLLEADGAGAAAPAAAAAPAPAAAAPAPAPAAAAAPAPAPAPAAAVSAGPVEVKVPDIGDFKEVEVIEVMVKVGDTIKVDQSLLTVESDKASMEIPSSHAGVVKEVKIKVGDKVAMGSVVLVVEATGGAAAPAPAAAAAAPAAAPAAAVAAPSPAPAAAAAAPAASQGSVQTGKLAHASPSIRKFARELGVDLLKVPGSGPKGRITQLDVQNYVKGVMAGTTAAPAGASSPAGGNGGMSVLPWPVIDFSKFGPTELLPLSRIKKISGPNLHRNWVMIPHVTQFDDADITDLEAFRVETNNANAKNKDAAKLTMLAFVIKASVAALKKFPAFNASLDEKGENLILKQYYNIGFAADTPNGLVVPVIKNADQKSVSQIAREMTELSLQAREGKLKPTDMQGASFTISSLGGIGGTHFTPIVNAPEVAILGLSKASIKPVWDGKAFQPRLMMGTSLSYDHRVVDGAMGARFSVYLSEVLGDMRKILL
ncbi:dihydrolipoyllysine-residue acetyltransferase component of pyruvate dehydrogenase complex [Janthinobacterium sp. HH01]|uniref:dihydrolipoyllysine-residue acetyltransferase n=1 Tax=Janthinobacterium sp. HH01 TaxID=1198452 RepID=UPI0002AEC186|nr:dihydrolipoyllysine-residue acetyltransferase [Janthinobacterium sp. HH01]ELX10448.1 dihydrolipoyllysine-residue acetyltransferase component of pyruvate dehydrogenase complex [Janthinobacterium sp. HH01]